MQKRTTEGQQTGKSLLPILIVLLAGVFLGLVIYQAAKPPSPDSGLPSGPSVSAGSGTQEAVGGGEQTSTRSEGSNGASEGAATREIDKEIRDTILAFFDRMPANVVDSENPMDIVQAREEFQDYLDSLPGSAAATLISILEVEEDFVNRRYLLYALGELGTDVAADGLLDHMDRMIDLGTKHSEVGHTIRAFALVDSPHSYDKLMDLAKEEGDIRPYRHCFIESLGEHPMRAEAIPTFTEMMGDRAIQVRIRSAKALEKTGEVQTSESIESALRDEVNTYVKQAMIGALGGLGDRNSIRCLSEVLQNEIDHVCRMSAVNSLSMIGGPEATALLERVVEEDANERVRADARRALQKM